MNKSFKFQSDWPNNGSQSYLLDLLVKDVLNDNNIYIGKEEKKYIQCRVNYPNNNVLYSQKIYLNKDYDVEKVEVLDQDGNVKITLKVSNINYKPKFDDDYFKLESLITETETDEEAEEDKTEDLKEEETDIEDNSKLEENQTEEDTEVDDESTGNILKDIIYPLYVPENTQLNTEDTISTENGNRAILTFSGDSPFVLVEEVAERFDELEIIPVNGDPLMLSDSMGAISSNSLYWTSNGIDYYISSNNLNSDELMTIAEGLTGTSVIVSSEK